LVDELRDAGGCDDLETMHATSWSFEFECEWRALDGGPGHCRVFWGLGAVMRGRVVG